MLRNASAAHALSHVALRYFNVAGADPQLRTGLSTPGATHLIKVAVEAALGRRARIDVLTAPITLTPDGTCIRDFIHVSDLRRAHLAALNYLRAGSASATLNCGNGRGYSIREVLDAVRHAIGHDIPGALCRPPPRRYRGVGRRRNPSSVRCWTGRPSLATSTRLSAMRLLGTPLMVQAGSKVLDEISA